MDVADELAVVKLISRVAALERRIDKLEQQRDEDEQVAMVKAGLKTNRTWIPAEVKEPYPTGPITP
jgi:hypothetical protein